MSLLRRLESSGASTQTPAPPTEKPAAPARPPDREGGQGTGTPASTLRRPMQAPAAAGRDVTAELKLRVQQQLINEIDPKADLNNTVEIRKQIRTLFDQILDQEGHIVTRSERERLFEEIAADIIGFGPLEPLLRDETITEVMVNGPHKVYVERKGKLVKTDVVFANNEHVRKIIDKIISPLGRRCDESSPMVDARLPDGSRVNAVIPPLSLDGPSITIRKFFKKPLTVEDLIKNGTLTTEVVTFLRACVEARLNIIVAGGTGSGKTTLLNIMSSFIPDDERIITIEDAAELQLRQEHVVRLET
ncbi:MAG: Flp pilus assembly complex ATPase component TadA, partial [Chloroflexi bacterium]|nr:Flp pilus assembly complex ATPase component TadA [Chloroflexota bacterium]